MVILEITEVPFPITVGLRIQNYFLANCFKSIRLLQKGDRSGISQVKGRLKTIRVQFLKIVKVT